MTFELQRLNPVHQIILPLFFRDKTKNKLVGMSCIKAELREGLTSTENKINLSIVYAELAVVSSNSLVSSEIPSVSKQSS